jgi:hypothetical protein
VPQELEQFEKEMARRKAVAEAAELRTAVEHAESARLQFAARQIQSWWRRCRKLRARGRWDFAAAKQTMKARGRRMSDLKSSHSKEMTELRKRANKAANDLKVVRACMCVWSAGGWVRAWGGSACRCVCMCARVCVCVCVCVYVGVSVCLARSCSPSLSAPRSLFSFSVRVCVCVTVSVCLRARTSFRSCARTSMRACARACVSARVCLSFVYLGVCSSTYLPT